MLRAVKVTTKFITKRKANAIASLLTEYRRVVNLYLTSLWETPGSLDACTLARVGNTRLTARLKSNALKQALEIAKGTRASALALNVVASRPVFNGSAVLDKKFITLEDGEKSFDLIVKVSCLKRGHRIVIPTRKTSLFNKWKSAGGILKQACTLSETSLVLYFELPDLPPKEGKHLGVDVGVNKLLVDSEGTEYGTKFKDFRNKITRKRLGSKSRKRAQVSRDNYINYVVNQLPWGFLSTLGVEALKNLKRGKQPRRGKSFRKALSPWTYSRMLKRIKELAQENRVCLVEINPAYTSQTCPECLHKERGNRVGEKFHCLACHYGADADFVGARNIGIRSAHQLRVGKPLEAPIHALGCTAYLGVRRYYNAVLRQPFVV